ncbi:DMT family transporter [Neisseria animalis]|uniref:DMT family transporter n=1 Tax=Neisseria animalis TaxID=492 RepID=A0A5P3MV98_NEIAN|nr:DMT family transporter [Neisseria animalis]QEY24589.1 DMT family transporter [Neisseria animalis]ROW32998.1 DMT family transporter [Neisseria animalis]VEE07431.1 putative transporter [Neisseria animalis]
MQQKPLLGFSLALLATATLGSLPIAAQQALKAVDAPTLVWARFAVAAGAVLVLLAAAKKLPGPSEFSWRTAGLILLGVAGISGNFLLVAEGLHYVSPTVTQILWQLAPFGMILVGLWVFKEQFGRWQKIGLLCLPVGLVMFFNDKFGELSDMGSYALGVALCAFGSLVWVCYGVAQKLLSEKFNAQQILLLIYFSCALVLAPAAEPEQIARIDDVFLIGCFVYCCLNTLIGYGAYGESLNHWDASKISVVTTMIPIFTMLFSHLGHAVAPQVFAAPDMNFLSYLGALVVVGSAVSAAAGDKLFSRKSG